MSALSRQAQPRCTCLPATSSPGAAAPAMLVSAAAAPAAEGKALMSETCNFQNTWSLHALCVAKCCRSRALCTEQGEAARVTEQQEWGCPLHLLLHKVPAPAPGWVSLPSAPGSWLPPILVPVWQVGFGQMPLSRAQVWLHLEWPDPFRLQQETHPEPPDMAMALLLTEVSASRV